MKETRHCPGGCGTSVNSDELACRPDWFRLPKNLRDRIWFAYRNRSKNPGAHAEVIAEAVEWYNANPRTPL